NRLSNIDSNYFDRVHVVIPQVERCQPKYETDRAGRGRPSHHYNSPSIDTRNESVCNNSLRGCKIKICPECGRPMKIRNGQYGDFWGCTGYGIKDDQCKVTIKVKAGL
ncbi:topoisomerase DNA-binding C4 zinc finger domain-containing protein, partial [Aeromonas veronii]